MTEEKKRRLAQSEDEMMERNLALIVARGKEVDVRTSVTDSPYTGFVAGLDEFYLQICLTKNSSQILVNRDHIVAIESTGRTLSDLEDNDFKTEIVEKVITFQKVCEKHSEAQQRRR